MTPIEVRLRNLAKQLSFESSYATMSVRRTLREAADEIERLRMTENDLYYLQSILRQLRELQSSLTDGDEVLADNVDWLASLIARGEKALTDREEMDVTSIS